MSTFNLEEEIDDKYINLVQDAEKEQDEEDRRLQKIRTMKLSANVEKPKTKDNKRNKNHNKNYTKPRYQ
jgi:hypothetical protein